MFELICALCASTAHQMQCFVRQKLFMIINFMPLKYFAGARGKLRQTSYLVEAKDSERRSAVCFNAKCVKPQRYAFR